MSIRRLKGSTIAEMIIVIAVLAIISTIVLSFVIVSNETVRSSNSKVDALNDIAVAESIVSSWVEDKIENNYELTVDINNDNTIINTHDNFKLSFVDEEIVVYDSNNVIIETLYKPTSITDIKFTVFNKESKQLVVCNITYEIMTTDNKKEYSYSFICYSYSYTQTDNNNSLQGGNSNEENN